jgi:hypothetical protein
MANSPNMGQNSLDNALASFLIEYVCFPLRMLSNDIEKGSVNTNMRKTNFNSSKT